MASDSDKKREAGATDDGLSPVARTVPRASEEPQTPLESADTELPSDPSEGTGGEESGEDLLGGRYRILNELGRGAEGVVFRALDVRARVVVALKLLQRDTARLGRLRRELQAARRVTHPNVVRIFDLVELPGELGLSMEYVEGETLARRLEGKGRLERKDLLSLAKNLAHALGAAHAAGVTHRDLKPANVILRDGTGGAAVTDFGIARMDGPAEPTPASADPGTSSARLTYRGVIVGTPLYMAPEQLEGRTDIGPAADVYAFGLVVREAATGERLDASVASLAELRAARAGRRLPPLGARCRDLPSALTRVVDRCLAERPEQRYANGTELARAVDAATAGSGSRLPRRLAAGLVAAVALGGVALWRMPRRSAKASPGRFVMNVSNPNRVTFGECEEFPSFSPDGTKLVYDASTGKNYFVYVMDLVGGGTRALTHVDGWDYAASVSPDGRSVAFLRNEGDSENVFVVPFDGSSQPRLLAHGSMKPTWSMDGKSIWAGERHHPKRYDAKTGEVIEAIKLAEGTALVSVREVKDGRRVALASSTALVDAWGVLLLDEKGGTRTLALGTFGHGLTPTPDGGHVLVSTMALGGNELMAVPLDGSDGAVLGTTQVHATAGMALSPDGRRIAWSTCDAKGGLARFDDSGIVAVRPDSEWADDDFAVIPGSHSIVTLSPRTGRREPWIVDLDGRAPDRALPIGDADPTGVAASADGWLAFTIRRRGIALVPLDGSAPPRMLTSDPSDIWPSFRHDGKDVLFSRQVGDSAELMSVPREGGPAMSFMASDARFSVASPTDERVAYLRGANADRVTPHLFDPVTGADRPLSPALEASRWRSVAFSTDASRVALGLGDREILEVEVASGIVKRRVRLDDDLGTLAYDGDSLLFLRLRYAGHILLGDVHYD